MYRVRLQKGRALEATSYAAAAMQSSLDSRCSSPDQHTMLGLK